MSNIVSAEAKGHARLCFVLPALGAGGSEHVVSLLAGRLADTGLQVSIITFENPDEAAYYAIDGAVRVRRLGLPAGSNRHGGRFTDIVRRVALLRAALREESPDLVISFLTRTNVIAVLAGLGLPIRIIVSERNNPELQNPGRIWNWLRRHTYSRAYGLVTMTRGAMEHFPPAMRRRSWVIPNMADWKGISPAPSGDRKVFAAVGRLVPQKGFDLLIAAFARAASEHPGWILRIWGEGPERGRLEAQVRESGLEGRVELPGVSERPGSWIASADAFVLSSRFEGWGLVLGEAMAAGLPVVSFNCKWGPAEMISDGHDGLLVADGDVDALTAAMARIMADPDLREGLARAAAISMQRFTPDRILNDWRRLVDAALKPAAAPEAEATHVFQ